MWQLHAEAACTLLAQRTRVPSCTHSAALCCSWRMCCAAAGEYISVSSQKDAEEADIEKERLEQLKGPEARQRELQELTGIYVAVRRRWVGAAAWYTNVVRCRRLS